MKKYKPLFAEPILEIKDDNRSLSHDNMQKTINYFIEHKDEVGDRLTNKKEINRLYKFYKKIGLLI
jgi:hypothetical protein